MADIILRKPYKRTRPTGPRFIDLTGRRFGRLVVLARVGHASGNLDTVWRCRCDCGNETDARASRMKGGSKASCGCLRSEAKRAAAKDFTGRKYGKWTVLRRGPYRERKGGTTATWICRCGCGREKEVISHSLTQGCSTSCGCTRRRDGGMEVHGYSKLPGYTLWHTMKQRCSNPKSSAYEKYGARGITVCARWLNFPLFSEDMGPRPSKRHSLDRIDNAKGYWCGRHGLCEECRARGNPCNVRWATTKDQMRNRTSNVFITHAGETLPLCVWAERSGVSPATIKTRLSAGWPAEKALTTPTRHKHSARSPSLIEAAAEIRAVRDRLAATLGVDAANTVVRSAARLATSTEPIPATV